MTVANELTNEFGQIAPAPTDAPEVRPVAAILLAFALSAAMMAAVLHLFSPGMSNPPAASGVATPAAPNSAISVVSELRGRRAAVFGSRLRALMRSLEDASLNTLAERRQSAPAELVGGLTDRVVAATERALNAPKELRRLIGVEGVLLAEMLSERGFDLESVERRAAMQAHADRSERLANEVQAVIDAQLEFLLTMVEYLRLHGDPGPDAEERAAVLRQRLPVLRRVVAEAAPAAEAALDGFNATRSDPRRPVAPQ